MRFALYYGDCMYDKLIEEGAPKVILGYAKHIENSTKAGLSPDRHMVQAIRDWLARQRGNNRYGH